MKGYIVFKKYGRLWAVPISYAKKPQVRRLLESSIIVQTPANLFEKPKIYRVKKSTTEELKKIEKETKLKLRKKARKPTGRPMPLAMQKKVLEKLAMKYEVPIDIIDWDRLDPTLTLTENRRVIEEQIRALTNRKDLVLEEIPIEKLEDSYRRFIENLIWKWEAGDTSDFELFGIDPKKIKKKEDILKLFL